MLVVDLPDECGLESGHQRWEIRLSGFPEVLEINSEVFVNQHAHTNDICPRNVLELAKNRLRYTTNRLADNLDIPDVCTASTVFPPVVVEIQSLDKLFVSVSRIEHILDSKAPLSRWHE